MKKIMCVLLVLSSQATAQTAHEASSSAYWNQYSERADEINSPDYWSKDIDEKPIPGKSITKESTLLERVNHCSKLDQDVSMVAEAASQKLFEQSSWHGGPIPHGEVRSYQHEIVTTANATIRDNRYARADGADVDQCVKNARAAILEIKAIVREALSRTY